MPIVDTTVPITSASCDRMILDIVARYPFCRTELLTQTAFQRPIRTLVIGNGPRKVIYSAAHHANEWITSYVLLKFAEELAEAIENGGEIFGISAAAIRDAATIYMVPMVDPDGVDLVVGVLQPGDIQFDLAQRLARDIPPSRFPTAGKLICWG